MNFQYIIKKKTKTCTYSTDKTQPNTKADHKANPGSAGGLVGLCFLKICVCSASARSLQWVYSGLLLGSALRNEVRSRPVFYLTACKSHPLHIPSTHVQTFDHFSVTIMQLISTCIYFIDVMEEVNRITRFSTYIRPRQKIENFDCKFCKVADVNGLITYFKRL